MSWSVMGPSLPATRSSYSVPNPRCNVKGEAKLTLGDDTVDARPGTWVHMPTGLRHSIQARTPVVILL